MKKLLLFMCVSMIFANCNSIKQEQRKIYLKGNPTTGYTWIFSLDDESLIEIEEEITYLGEENIVGAPSMFEYTIIPKKEGTTKVHFKYLRPWLEGSEIDERNFIIIVDSKKGVEIKEEKND